METVIGNLGTFMSEGTTGEEIESHTCDQEWYIQWKNRRYGLWIVGRLDAPPKACGNQGTSGLRFQCRKRLGKSSERVGASDSRIYGNGGRFKTKKLFQCCG